MMSKMTNAILMGLLLASVMTVSPSCADRSGEGSGDGGNDNPSTSLWKMETDRLSKVEVVSGGSIIETYEFKYDDYSRLTSLIKRDLVGGNKLLDLKYSYKDDSKVEISGIYYPLAAERSTTAVIDADSRSVSYTGNWKGAWTFTTAYDGDGTVLSTEVSDNYAAGSYYSADVKYSEEYEVVSRDVRSVRMSVSTSVDTQVNTNVSNSNELKVEYTYSDKYDDCNFNVFLMNCEFPVWFAKGLPGCLHLISGMTASHAGVASPVSFKMSYTFNSSNQLKMAVRKDYEGSNLVLEKTYRLYYVSM